MTWPITRLMRAVQPPIGEAPSMKAAFREVFSGLGREEAGEVVEQPVVERPIQNEAQRRFIEQMRGQEEIR